MSIGEPSGELPSLEQNEIRDEDLLGVVKEMFINTGVDVAD